MKKFIFKKAYLFFSSLFIFILHVPFVFAKTKTPVNFLDEKTTSNPIIIQDSPFVNSFNLNVTIGSNNLYDSFF